MARRDNLHWHSNPQIRTILSPDTFMDNVLLLCHFYSASFPAQFYPQACSDNGEWFSSKETLKRFEWGVKRLLIAVYMPVICLFVTGLRMEIEMTNQMSVFRSRDKSIPIRGQYSDGIEVSWRRNNDVCTTHTCHGADAEISDQSEASVQVTWSVWTNQRPGFWPWFMVRFKISPRCCLTGGAWSLVTIGTRRENGEQGDTRSSDFECW